MKQSIRIFTILIISSFNVWAQEPGEVINNGVNKCSVYSMDIKFEGIWGHGIGESPGEAEAQAVASCQATQEARVNQCDKALANFIKNCSKAFVKKGNKIMPCKVGDKGMSSSNESCEVDSSLTKPIFTVYEYPDDPSTGKTWYVAFAEDGSVSCHGTCQGGS